MQTLCKIVDEKAVRPFQEIDSLKNMKKAVSNSRRTISLEGNVFLELPKCSYVCIWDGSAP